MKFISFGLICPQKLGTANRKDIYNIIKIISLFRASSNFKAYDASIPHYLHNRPRTVVQHCMKRLHSIDHNFGSGDIDKRIDGTSEAYTVKSMDKRYQVTMGSEKEFPNCTCEDFRRNFLPCKHFFAVFKFSNQSWNNLSPLYIESPFLNLDFGAINTRTKEHNIVVSSDNLNTGDENQDKDDAGLQESIKLQRDVVAILKDMQNKAYICSNNDALSKCIPILKSANDMLSANAEKQEGLPLRQEDKLRNLPRRKKHFKQFGKFQKRVGKKAKIMREASVLGTCTKEGI